MQARKNKPCPGPLKARDTCASVNVMMLQHRTVGPQARHHADGRLPAQTPHLILGVVDTALQPTQRIQALPPGSPLASMSCTTRPFALQASLWTLSSAVPLAVWRFRWGALLRPVAVSPALLSSAGGDLNRASSEGDQRTALSHQHHPATFLYASGPPNAHIKVWPGLWPLPLEQRT